MSSNILPRIDRWRLLEAFLQAVMLPLETLYFIATNDWTLSMIRVLVEVAVDLLMNSVLGGASVAVATIMLVREMGGGGAGGGAGAAAAGDARATSKQEPQQPQPSQPQALSLAQALGQARRASAGRSRIPLITSTKMFPYDSSSQTFQTKAMLNSTNLEELRQKPHSAERSEQSPLSLPPALGGRGASRLLYERLGSS